ncbi:hypothetical protein [Actinoplanes xinjiangensis]|uniref:hypothetical protein n=1 Tax=Actinoplanes xinjiangensis TaxID=512350 RepID=UPI0011B4DFE5|nr:hypothetical protein [Actinoplanes xinjiangensis]
MSERSSSLRVDVLGGCAAFVPLAPVGMFLLRFLEAGLFLPLKIDDRLLRVFSKLRRNPGSFKVCLRSPRRPVTPERRSLIADIRLFADHAGARPHRPEWIGTGGDDRELLDLPETAATGSPPLLESLDYGVGSRPSASRP